MLELPLRRNRYTVEHQGDYFMRILLASLAVAACISGSALAQDAPASTGANTATGSSNAAVNGTGNQASTVNASGTINVVSPSALEKGANSFTEGQARSRIESAGITAITGLHKDDMGIWRGTGTRNGKNVTVGFDYKGTIGAE